MHRFPLIATAALAGLAFLGPQSAGQDVARVGKAPEYSFEAPVINGLGVTALASLKGKPTLFEFWGTY